MAAILLTSEDFAQGVAVMNEQQFDSLVTKDYLDSRFSEFEARLGREMDRGFDAIRTQFDRMDVMLVLIMAGTSVLCIQSLMAFFQ